MKKNQIRSHKLRNFCLTLSLAAVCVGGAELTTSRYFDPALYEQVTAPARAAGEAAVQVAEEAAQAAGQAAAAAEDTAEGMLQALSARWEALTAPRIETEALDTNSQAASDPMFSDLSPMADPADTELKELNGLETLTGGLLNIVYFNQADEQWAEQPYGRDNIGKYGCGPTAMAMAVSSMTDQVVDPAAMAQFAVEQGYWAPQQGSYLTIVEGIAQAYGLDAQPFAGRTADELCDAILSGRILVALMGPGHFTKSGHFILLRGVTLDGKILVADSNSRERSLTLWDPEVILDELSYATANGAPLWELSQS
jgi:hypothetical protein